ncbi:hypothetical protein [Virgibacillus salexigens]|uniref:Replication protein n=1 Tax=Virgibacillus massiliensis TaxID=1462526 RepID=A0A024QC70_9BACI|nr:hypothetical protein [Virgibacillus massiliensis]CDQ39516.1 hypothetical protein BN990_01821 [Virgibacillus massiliensis]
MQGYISLHRKLMENPIWADPNYLKLWIYCLFEATHKEREQLVGNQMVKLERGQFITGRYSLSEDMNRGVKPKQKLDKLTWWRHLNNLEKFGMLNIKSTNKYSIVTIVNYDVYQSNQHKTEQDNEHQMNNKRTSDEHHLNTNNNVNNGNNKKNSPKQVYDETSIYYQLAEYFLDKIRNNNPEHKTPNMQTWSDDIRKMMELDKRSEKQIKYLMDWVQKDDFEMSNVLSPSKLRKRFDQLVIKVKKEKGTVQQPTERKKSREQLEQEKLWKEMQERLNA